MRLSRDILKSIVPGEVVYPPIHGPLQLSMGGCPWRVSICSMLLCRTRRSQAQPILYALLERWPDANSLALGDESLENLIRPLGLHRNRVRHLRRFSSMWVEDSWEDLKELPGVGNYVADSVGLFCLGDTSLTCNDHVLVAYAESLRPQGA